MRELVTINTVRINARFNFEMCKSGFLVCGVVAVELFPRSWLRSLHELATRRHCGAVKTLRVVPFRLTIRRGLPCLRDETLARCHVTVKGP